MLLTITTTYSPATDLGYLLHKQPGTVQSLQVAGGQAHFFYSQADRERCTAVLMVEVDPVALVRGRRAGAPEAFGIGQYVNDRPYAASSLLAVAIRRVFSTALAGRSRERPALAGAAIPLEIRVPALPCRGGEALPERFFGPLGWRVEAKEIALDEAVPSWGLSQYVDLSLYGDIPLHDALSHLYVLLPALDDAKHYWVTDDEVDKLVRVGGRWLATHPERQLIASRYLAHQRSMAESAVGRLEEMGVPGPGPADPQPLTLSGAGGRPLAAERRAAVTSLVQELGARRVLDLGCGEGALLQDLMRIRGLTEVVGVDLSSRMLEMAARRLRLEQMSDRQRGRIGLVQSSITYRDARLRGYDLAVLMEVIEHVDPARLAAAERVVFGYLRPLSVVVTTPNREFNGQFLGLVTGQLRHHDHRFEWSRAEFRAWATRISSTFGYRAQHREVGDLHPEAGAPTQLVVLRRADVGSEASAEAAHATG